MPTGPSAAPAPDHAQWTLQAFERLADLVVVVDPTGSIVWTNPFARDLLGFETDESVESNFADYVHPDDLVRALRVMSLMVDRRIDVEVTPAIYRVRRKDGSWCPIEINASMVPGPAGDDPGAGLLMIFGRYSGDRDLSDQIMEQLTSGREPTEVIQLIPGFGRWRHPLDHYAVRYGGGAGEPLVAGTPVACELAEIEVTGSPWERAASSGTEAAVGLADLPEELRRAAAARGLAECWAVPVADPLHGEPATIIAWVREGSDLEVHRYAVETMARLLTLVLQWRQQVTSLRQAARRDPLTGLINRSGFLEQLEAAGVGTDPARIGVLYIDLDGFKGVNDVHGHRVGDSVLAHVGQRLTGVLRPGDVVGRLGGDEFAVLCPELNTDDDAVAIAQRVVDALERPFVADGLEVQIGASVGIATTAPGELEAEQLIDTADQALYRAKGDGRGRWHLLSTAPVAEPDR